MADLSQVEDALVQAVSTILFTSSYTPYAVQMSDTAGIRVRLFRGWPIDNQLELDLRSGTTNISIFSSPHVARNATRALRNSTITNTSQAASTMTAILAGNVVTFAGTGSSPQGIGIGIRKRGGGYGFTVRPTDGQTPTSVAALFAANMPHAVASGGQLTISEPPAEIIVEYGGDVTTLTEVHRNDQMFMVTIWSPTVPIRDQLSRLIDPQLCYIDHLQFPDGSVSDPVIGAGTLVDDVVQKEFMWRRTLYYMVNYPTEYTTIEPVMLLGKTILSSNITLID